MGGFIGNSTVNSAITAADITVGSNSSYVTYKANSTGMYVNTTFIANSTGPYGKTEGALNVNSALTANNSTNLGGVGSASYRLISSGQVITAGTKCTFQQTAAPTGFTKSTLLNDYAMRVVSGTASTGGSVAFSTAFASQSVTGSISTTTATNQAATQGGNISSTTATNQAATQGGNISSTTATNQAATQGGNISTTTATNQAATQGGNISSYTLTVSDLPSHSHGVSDPGHTHGIKYHQRAIDGSQFDGDGSLRSNNAFTAGYIQSVTTGISLQNTGLSGGHNHLFTGSSHNHTQDAHSHTFTGSSHNHTQDAHSHTFTGSSHNHTQDAHSHTFTGSSHNHTQDAHNHTFTGTSINLAVQYVDFILATADA